MKHNRQSSRQRRARRVLLWSALAMAGLISAIVGQEAERSPRRVLMLTVDGDVNPVLVEYIRRGIREGSRRHAEMVIIRLNTPGGQLVNTRQIAQDFLASAVPICVYVWPDGAYAASAGTFITIAAHVAAMAPNTNLGAAHPITMGGSPGGEEESSGKQGEVLMDKITNDAVALIRNLADERGRDADWAEKAVRQSVSATAKEAVALGVVDFIADDVPDLLRKADGMPVKLKQGEHVLQTANARVDELPMSLRERILFPIANPNVAYILMLLGVYGLIMEMKSPGFGGAGIVGAICLVLGLFALSVFEVNVAGLLLILVGILFLYGELLTPTFGLLTLGGVVALALGSLMLIDSPDVRINRWVIAGMVAATTGFFVFIIGAIVKGQKRRVVTGEQGMLGQIGEARTPLAPVGTVFVDGTLWTAEAEEGEIAQGAEVEVTAVHGLRLTVRAAGSQEAAADEPPGSPAV